MALYRQPFIVSCDAPECKRQAQTNTEKDHWKTLGWYQVRYGRRLGDVCSAFCGHRWFENERELAIVNSVQLPLESEPTHCLLCHDNPPLTGCPVCGRSATGQ